MSDGQLTVEGDGEGNGDGEEVLGGVQARVRKR